MTLIFPGVSEAQLAEISYDSTLLKLNLEKPEVSL